MVLDCALADLNHDGIIDTADLTLVSSRMGTKTGDPGYPGYPGYDIAYDINKDGIIDITDLSTIGRCFGQSLQASSSSVDPPSMMVSGICVALGALAAYLVR